MIESIRKMWKIGELRKKILYTFLMLVLFRLVGVIPAPGVDVAKVMSQNNSSTLPVQNTLLRIRAPKCHLI